MKGLDQQWVNSTGILAFLYHYFTTSYTDLLDITKKYGSLVILQAAYKKLVHKVGRTHYSLLRALSHPGVGGKVLLFLAAF